MIVRVKPKKMIYENNQWYVAGEEFEVNSIENFRDLVIEAEPNIEIKIKPKNKRK